MFCSSGTSIGSREIGRDRCSVVPVLLGDQWKLVEIGVLSSGTPRGSMESVEINVLLHGLDHVSNVCLLTGIIL